MATVVMELQDLYDRSDTDLTTRFKQTYLETQIADAVALVEATCPSVPARLLADTLSPNIYKRRVADMVLRVTRNTGGFASESEGGAAYSVIPVVASGNLWMTQADIDALNGVIPQGRKLPSTATIGLDVGYGS